MISGINIQNYSKITSQKRNFKQKKKFLKTYELDQGKKKLPTIKTIKYNGYLYLKIENF